MAEQAVSPDAKGLKVTSTHPFLWQDGKMKDLGTLGGTQATVAPWDALNGRGEVVGQNNLAGNKTFHPFLWDGGHW